MIRRYLSILSIVTTRMHVPIHFDAEANLLNDNNLNKIERKRAKMHYKIKDLRNKCHTQNDIELEEMRAPKIDESIFQTTTAPEYVTMMLNQLLM